MPERADSWFWSIGVSDWPIGRADYDLTADEALAALTGRADPAPSVPGGAGDPATDRTETRDA